MKRFRVREYGMEEYTERQAAGPKSAAVAHARRLWEGQHSRHGDTMELEVLDDLGNLHDVSVDVEVEMSFWATLNNSRRAGPDEAVQTPDP